ncbi:MAG: LTA synthase family protein [Lachnospiraceae bacterium]|nr:LTA synthase family protein [Lachnospiraceae bacterium]
MESETGRLNLKKTVKNIIDKVRQCTPWQIYGVFALFIFPVATFYLFDGYTHNAFVEMAGKTQFLNMIFYWLIAIFLFGLFRRLNVALMVETVFFMVVGLANYYVLEFRSAPIMPWDIYSIGTAATVADNFDYSLEQQAVYVLVGFGILLVLEFFCKTKIGLRKGKIRAVLCAAALLLLSLYTNVVQSDSFVRSWGMYDKLFTPTVMCKRDGNVVAFLMELKYLEVDKPQGYEPEEVARYLSKDTTPNADVAGDAADNETVGMTGAEQLPNIIVVMNEAFSDLAVLGDFETNVDYMPFFRSLQDGEENTRTGTLHVSVMGGNTANTEFEFLTGSSMAFLPQGSVAYQQYVNGEVPSMASYLKELGYETIAMHPYYASGWERDEVYPRLGFDEFIAINSFQGSKKYRNYYSDEACYEKIIDLFEEKDESPLFVFNVTMQNHSGYTGSFNNFKADVEVEGASSEALQNYLSLIKISDGALEKLITYFSKVKEETMIVFFGDHQPTVSVSRPVLKLNGKNTNTLTEEEQSQYYEVPYMIWSNFDIAEETEEEMSVNFLAGEVFELCGLELPPYWQELDRVRKEYPIVTSVQVQDAGGEVYEPEEVEEDLNFYRQIQYYMLFE